MTVDDLERVQAELERNADQHQLRGEWLSVGELGADHLIAEHRAAVETLTAYRRRTHELVAEVRRLQTTLDGVRRDRLVVLDRVRQLEHQLEGAHATIARAGIEHGHDVARLLELEAQLDAIIEGEA